MRVVIHAGMHKTGTTSFQDVLRRNRARLEAHGIRVHVLPPQLLAKRPDEFDPGWISATLTAAASDGMDEVLFSHEAVSLLPPARMKALAEPFAGYPVRVVVAFRHWTGFLPSRWRQNCTRRDSQPFGRYLATVLETAPPLVGRFDQVLVAARGAFDDVVVVSYDKAVADGVLLQVLSEACGISRTVHADLDGLATTHLNRRDGARQSDLLRLFNGVVADARGLPHDTLHGSQIAGIPAGEMFDLGGKVGAILAANPALAARLDQALTAHDREVTLTEADFAPWAVDLERAVEGLVWNPSGGRLFAPIADRRITASDLEHRDLPADLAQEMVESVRRLVSAA